VTGADLIDAYLKGGWSHLADSGPWTWTYFAASIPAVRIGIRSTKPRHHALMGAAFFMNELGIAFDVLPHLGL
jgi:hypothetical protein